MPFIIEAFIDFSHPSFFVFFLIKNKCALLNGAIIETRIKARFGTTCFLSNVIFLCNRVDLF
jgi:hypothetical protein